MSERQKEEFLELIHQHEGIMHKVTRLYVDDPEERKDLVQEILFQAFRSFGNFRREANFSTWLYRIALNTVLTWFKKPNVGKQSREVKESDLIDTSEHKKDQGEVLMWALKQISEIDRMIISLSLEGYKNEEIATITGLSKNNIAVKIHRIKQQLTQIIQKA